MSIAEQLLKIKQTIPSPAQLVAVSKTHPAAYIQEAYQAGQRIFGESKAQELQEKQQLLPADIAWHFIGHLQTNKIKYLAAFVSMIHSIDSLYLLQAINKEAAKNNRIINCLLQIHIAQEETKFGLSEQELNELLTSDAYKALKNISICGLMGMATLTEDKEQVRKEFRMLKQLFDQTKVTHFSGQEQFTELSMGMSDDYPIALEEGSTLVRVGSAIFGYRNYNS